MVKSSKLSDRELMRLDAMAKHLRIKRRYPDEGFEDAVRHACLRRVEKILDGAHPRTGEEVTARIATHFNVQFAEVRGPDDIAALEERYLKRQSELGFARLRRELKQPGVDALLFQRMNALEDAPDRWVAVLNLQESTAKSFWNKIHELGHRIGEPPQKLLPFRRHRFERNPVESIVDQIAADIGFYAPVFGPMVRSAARGALTFQRIASLRSRYAPTASLLAVMNATVQHWPQPALALTAWFQGRKNAPHKDQALRVAPQGYNALAKPNGLFLYPNMRVPESSPIHTAYVTGDDVEDAEDLGQWTTSRGGALPSMSVFTSAKCIGDTVYALIAAV